MSVPIGRLNMTIMAIIAVTVGAASAAEPIIGRASVIDGDTIDVHGERIRIWGIDAPESGQTCQRDKQDWRCGTDAAFALDNMLARRPVTCRQKDRDRYGRTVATCRVGDVDIGGWMVREGWALDYRRYSKAAYAADEDVARTEQRGMWAGEFMPPWEWRRR